MRKLHLVNVCSVDERGNMNTTKLSSQALWALLHLFWVTSPSWASLSIREIEVHFDWQVSHLNALEPRIPGTAE
jgi:hypothetical protein